MNQQIKFDINNHEFTLKDSLNSADVLNSIKAPLSVILQVTRKCNLDCLFCSESDQYPDPSYSSLIELIDKLDGTRRVYLSGGEPLIRKDIYSLIDEYSKAFEIVGLPTNSTPLTKENCAKLEGKISYINAGLDGPRVINNLVRGEYDKIISGLLNLKDSGIEVSLSSVILKKTLPYLKYIVQIADVVGIKKVKMVIPIFRGRAKNLTNEDLAPKQEILDAFEEIKNLKNVLGWSPRVKFTFWDKTTEGYALIVYPNRQVYAWPILDAEDGVEYIGDLNKQNIKEIWEAYPYKLNHINKYTGISMYKG